MDWFPPGARKTILGRVNPVTGALILVIANIEFNRRGASEIHPVDIIIRTDGLHDLILVRTILTV
jgi:hypothetical protein